jgi:hypothetical protein
VPTTKIVSAFLSLAVHSHCEEYKTAALVTKADTTCQDDWNCRLVSVLEKAALKRSAEAFVVAFPQTG